MGLLDNAGQGGEFRLIPRHDNGGAFNEGQIELLADAEIFGITGFHAAQLKTFRRRVKARVEECAVALGGAGQDVTAAFQQNAFQSGNGEATGKAIPTTPPPITAISIAAPFPSHYQKQWAACGVPVSAFRLRSSVPRRWRMRWTQR